MGSILGNLAKSGAFGLAGYGLAKSGLFSGPKVDPYGTLNPEQIATTKLLGNKINTALGSTPEPYSGQLNTDVTPEEQASIANYNRLNAINSNSLGQLANYNDPNFNDQFDQEIAAPSFRAFSTYAQPALEEAVPSSSSARANIVSRSLGDLQNSLLTQRFSAREAAKNRALQAGQDIQSAGVTSSYINSIPRTIQQAGLDKAYAEFTRQNEQGQKNIDNAMQFLGISTKTQDNNSPLQQLISLIKSGAEIYGATKGGA